MLGVPTLLPAQIELHDRFLLSQPFSEDQLREHLLEPGQWQPYPAYEDRAAWEAQSASLRQAQIARGAAVLGQSWPSLTATLTLEFVRNGLRTPYQEVSFARRQRLADLVMAELLEGEGRFLDDITDGIWLICEESYWGVPAHLYLQADSSGLPDVQEPTVDLFAAETAALLAWTHQLLAQPLDEISPLIRQRIRLEVKRRLLEVNLAREDFWWMGFERNEKGINNWTVWINSNWLVAAMLLEEDRERQLQAIYKIMRSIDEFLNQYPEDGSCDEGPTYWTRAGASLFECLEVLSSATEGHVNIFDQPLIRRMAQYIYLTHLGADYYVNFADAQVRQAPSGALVARFGEQVADPQMVQFGAFLAQQHGQLTTALSSRSLGRRLAEWFYRPTLATQPARSPLPQEVWLPDNELWIARQQTGSSQGLTLVAKGFTNGQSHNHNDVGSFMVYVDGQPALIDVGVGTYTRQTFSEDRYDIWTMQSGYHNLPTIDETMQQAGWEFKASNVQLQRTERASSLQMELSAAYPDSAGLKSYLRKLLYQREQGQIQLREEMIFEQLPDSISFNWMSAGNVDLSETGVIKIQLPTEASLTLRFNPRKLTPRIEEIPLDDPRLSKVWGPRIYRVRLVQQRPARRNILTFSLSPTP
jgi:hypothetical protein